MGGNKKGAYAPFSSGAVIRDTCISIGADAMSVSLRLPSDLNQRLSYLAEKTGRSKTFYMLKAINEHLDTCIWPSNA